MISAWRHCCAEPSYFALECIAQVEDVVMQHIVFCSLAAGPKFENDLMAGFGDFVVDGHFKAWSDFGDVAGHHANGARFLFFLSYGVYLLWYFALALWTARGEIVICKAKQCVIAEREWVDYGCLHIRSPG